MTVLQGKNKCLCFAQTADKIDMMGIESSNDVVFLGRFIWDKRKAEANRKKHHISFETASFAFSDVHLFVEYDAINSSIDEDRYNCVGLVQGVLFLFITMTDRNGFIRIISARKAEKDEIRKYEKNATNI